MRARAATAQAAWVPTEDHAVYRHLHLPQHIPRAAHGRPQPLTVQVAEHRMVHVRRDRAEIASRSRRERAERRSLLRRGAQASRHVRPGRPAYVRARRAARQDRRDAQQVRPLPVPPVPPPPRRHAARVQPRHAPTAGLRSRASSSSPSRASSRCHGSSRWSRSCRTSRTKCSPDSV